MSSLVISGDTSGSVTLQAPAVSGTTTLTLPSVSGTVITTGSSGQSIPKAALPTGSVLQVVSATTSTYTSIASTSYTDITGLTASITPTSSSSKILVLVSLNGRQYSAQNGNRSFFYNIVRTATQIFESALVDVQGGLGGGGFYITSSAHSLIYLDSPSTTSSVTYKCQGKVSSTASSTALEVNNSPSSSTITLMEISA